MTNRIRTFLLGALVLPLAAQESTFTVGGALINGLESLKKATNNGTAFLVGADYNTVVWSTQVPARIGLSFAAMPGSERYGLKTSLNLIQIHGDILLDGPTAAWHPVLGLSLNKYSMSRSGNENLDDSTDVNHHFPVRDVKGMKVGFRVGLDYAVNNKWTVELMFQQTELAGKDTVDPYVRQGAINPGWIELGARFKF